ncbi:MAG: hypothetical protein K9H64_20795 [Bacteroidales bacterium]|nr:hypothetical protein [Bacteroidales bacterium]MCF8458454.1 hypothetical protein [Bacteroidales bacterium]
MDHEGENIFDKIKEVFGKLPGSLNVLEEQIDIELQMEYFKASKRSKEVPVEEIIGRKDELFSEILTPAQKKKLLVQLASVDDVEAFRTIEKFMNKPDKGLREWSILAFQESRMILESSLLDENQVFISTGLGGKGTKLRYFIVLVHHGKTDFDTVQQKLVQSEFDYSLSKHNGELESIIFSGPFAKMLAVVPIQAPLKELFQNAIHEANQIGDFIKENFIVTNVKQLSDKEISDFLDKPQDDSAEFDDDFDDE